MIPATVSGLVGVVWAVRGIATTGTTTRPLPDRAIIVGGVVAYVVLLAITTGLLRRPATTELILITGWGMLALAQINAFVGTGRFSHGLAAGLILITGLALVISLACYTLYYRLDRGGAYVAGMIPLILAALSTVLISCLAVIRGW